MTSVHKRNVVLKKGDVVRVKSGELRDLQGDVDSIQGKVVVIRPHSLAIKDKLEFSIDELEKYFEQGDHVKVVSGRRAGVTGTVVFVEGEIIQVLTDISREEIRVFSSDLQDSNEISTVCCLIMAAPPRPRAPAPPAPPPTCPVCRAARPHACPRNGCGSAGSVAACGL